MKTQYISKGNFGVNNFYFEGYRNLFSGSKKEKLLREKKTLKEKIKTKS
ncbi:hypothetical protein SDC9_37417 [bioreactor metagenome]|jgi:hypothetical protein|uniref:Uncharacterized protein n=1 Tax=bioreactor metagenome TaxID=1076179 RepID=A0A644VIY1_9ZZZZ